MGKVYVRVDDRLIHGKNQLGFIQKNNKVRR